MSIDKVLFRRSFLSSTFWDEALQADETAPDEAIAIPSYSSYGAVCLSQALYLFHKYLAALYVFCRNPRKSEYMSTFASSGKWFYSFAWKWLPCKGFIICDEQSQLHLYLSLILQEVPKRQQEDLCLLFRPCNTCQTIQENPAMICDTVCLDATACQDFCGMSDPKATVWDSLEQWSGRLSVEEYWEGFLLC